MVNTFQSGVASAERVFELLDADAQSTEIAAYAVMAQPRGRVEFSRVSFSYNPDRPLITDLSLMAEPGRTIAIVGPTGGGKTTPLIAWKRPLPPLSKRARMLPTT